MATPPPAAAGREGTGPEEQSQASMALSNGAGAGVSAAGLAAARRSTMCGEHYEPEADPELYVRVLYAKSDARRAWLRATLEGIFFLRELDAGTVDELVDAFEFRDVQRCERVIAQGDNGDYLYLVFAGRLEAHVRRGMETRLAKSYDGDGFFGELALMYNQKRAATVTAVTDCTLARLDRQTFKRIDVRGRMEKRARYHAFLKSVELLQSLDELERDDVADNLQALSFEHNQLIVEQGAAGDCMYFVESGEVRCTQREEGGEREVARVKRGGYFGELALLTRNPRACSVWAVGHVKLACLQVDGFERLMGPCVEVMRQRAGAYSPQLAALLRQLDERERSDDAADADAAQEKGTKADES